MKHLLDETPLICEDGEQERVTFLCCFNREPMVLSLRKVAAEVVGTFFLMMAACGSIMAGWNVQGQALTVGFCLVGLISSLGPISGAHFNPAITLAFATTGQCAWSEVLLYIASEVVGGTFAMFVAKLLYEMDGQQVALTLPSGGWVESFFMEVILTFSLAFVATSTNHLPKINGVQGGVAVGLVVAMNMMLGGNLSGASMNPIRSLAPAIVQNNYTYIWIYIIAPCIGAVLGALSYTSFRMDQKAYPS